MFYKQIPKKDIPKNIQRSYKYYVKPYIGQIVICDHKVLKVVDVIRDDKVDGEWCVRFLHFPSRASTPQVSDYSMVYCDIIPLKGVIPKKQYKDLVRSWKMNEERCPYNKDYSKEE